MSESYTKWTHLKNMFLRAGQRAHIKATQQKQYWKLVYTTFQGK